MFFSKRNLGKTDWMMHKIREAVARGERVVVCSMTGLSDHIRVELEELGVEEAPPLSSLKGHPANWPKLHDWDLDPTPRPPAPEQPK